MTAPSTREIGYVTPSYGTTNAWWQHDPDEDTLELQWPMSVKVYNAMRTQDAQVGSVLEAVTRPVLRTPWRLDPAGARDEVVKFVADDLGLPIVGQNPKPPPRTKDRFSWLEHLELALLMLPFGHMYFEQVYRVNKAGTEAHLGKLSPRMPRTIEQIDVARDGGLISITQLGTMDQRGPQKPIPVRHLVAYVYKKEGGNWLGRSVLRQAYKNWLIKDRLLRVQAQTIERNGMGIPVYEAAEEEQDLAKGLALTTSLRAGEAAGAAIPNTAKLRLMGVEGQLPDALPAVKYHDEQIARAVLAHFLNLDTQSHGSYALGTTFADFFTLSLQTLAQQIAGTASMHIVEDLVDANWGPEEPAPRICFDEIGSRQAATAQAIKLLIDAGVIQADEVLEQSTRQQYGLPPKDKDTVREPADGGGFGTPTEPNESAEYGEGSAVYASGDAGPKALSAGSAGDIDVYDDDESGQFDEVTEALAAVIAEFTGVVQAKAGPDFNIKHPRNPKTGEFRTVFGRVMNALQQWSRGEGGDQPLKGQGFTRDNLRTVATKNLGLTVRRGAPADEIEKQLLDYVRDATKGKREQGKPSAKFTLQGKPDAAKIREIEVENRIRAAYREVGTDHVMLSDLRRKLGDLPRSDVDAALTRMNRGDYDGPGDPVVVPQSNQKALTQADRDAAIHVGGQDKHAISFGDASPRPLPKSLRDLDVAVYRDKDGHPALFREDENGKRGALVQRFDSLAEMEKWAEANGEPRLAQWARTEKNRGLQKDATDRQSQIDKARTVADTLAEVDELLDSEADRVVVERRLKAARQGGAPDDVVDRLLAAVATGDRRKVDKVRADIAKDHGLTPTGSAGGVESFDRTRHQMIAGTKASAVVHVVRPGYEYDRDGEKVRLSKAVVEEASPDEAAQWARKERGGKPPAKRAPAKKATPRKATGTPGVAARVNGSDLIGDGATAEVASSALATATSRRTSEGSYGQIAGPHGDEVAFAIAERQGFDRPPRVVSVAEFDRLVADGHLPLYRGVFALGSAGGNEDDFADRLRAGDTYLPTGVWGSGIYTSRQLHTARRYGPNPIRMALPPDARVADWRELKEEHKTFLAGLDPDSDEHRVFSDLGRYVASRGFDAMRIEGSLEDEVLVFNRSALIVREPSPKAATHELPPPAEDPSPRPRPAAPRKATGTPAAAKKVAPGKMTGNSLAEHMDVAKWVVDTTPSYGTAAYHGVVPDLSGLTIRQKRARLRSLGFTPEQIDELAPTAAMVKKASRVRAAAGHDVTPGNDELHHYWTKGPGLMRWRGSPTPWTTLVALLTEHVGVHKAKIFASKWFWEVFGIWSGERKGSNPLGPG